MIEQNEVSLSSLFTIISASWRRLLLISLAVGLAVMILFNFITPRYLSEARVLFAPGGSYQNPVAGRNQDVTIGVGQTAVLSQIQVIQSRDIINSMIEKTEIEKDEEFLKKILGSTSFFSFLSTPKEKYKKLDPSFRREIAIDKVFDGLKVASLSESRVIGIQYYSTDPVRAAKIANGLAKAYIEWQRSESVQQNQEDTIRLARLITDLKKIVKQSEAAVTDYRAKKGIYKTTRNNITLNNQQLTELNRRIIAARELRTESEIRAKLIREMLNREGDVVNTSDAMRSPIIQRLFEQKNRVKRSIAEVSATLLPSHPRLKQLRSELAGTNEQIRSEMRRIVRTTENDAKIARAREESLQQSLNDLKNLSVRADGDEIQLRALEREARTNRDLLNTYLARFRDAEARGVSAIAPAYATIVSKAHVPTEPYFPKTKLLTILATVATFLLGIGFLIMREVLLPSEMKVTSSSERNEKKKEGKL